MANKELPKLSSSAKAKRKDKVGTCVNPATEVLDDDAVIVRVKQPDQGKSEANHHLTCCNQCGF
jgi:hypothetical protein